MRRQKYSITNLYENLHYICEDEWDKPSTKKEGKQMANRNIRQTSKKVASKASKILTDGRYGKNAKSVAGSALSQTKPSKKK